MNFERNERLSLESHNVYFSLLFPIDFPPTEIMLLWYEIIEWYPVCENDYEEDDINAYKMLHCFCNEGSRGLRFLQMKPSCKYFAIF